MELPHMGDALAGTHSARKATVSASARPSVTSLSSTRCHSPDLRCWLRFQSSMASSASSGWAMASSGPSASTFNCESVTTVAISRMESWPVSNPVISRSIQMSRSLFALLAAMHLSVGRMRPEISGALREIRVMSS